MAAWSNSAFNKVLESEAEQERFYQNYSASEEVLDVLVKVLKSKTASSELDSESKDGYNSPNWAYNQADLIGYRRAIKEMIALMSIREAKPMTGQEKL